jgi:hypothetical protein
LVQLRTNFLLSPPAYDDFHFKCSRLCNVSSRTCNKKDAQELETNYSAKRRAQLVAVELETLAIYIYKVLYKKEEVTIAYPLKTVFLQKNSLPHQGLASIKVSLLLAPSTTSQPFYQEYIMNDFLLRLVNGKDHQSTRADVRYSFPVVKVICTAVFSLPAASFLYMLHVSSSRRYYYKILTDPIRSRHSFQLPLLSI